MKRFLKGKKEKEVKRVLVFCTSNTTRGHIVNIVKGSGYNVIRADTVGSLESLRKSGVADLVIIGQHANADIIIQWMEKYCSEVPIIFIGNCECESEKIAHHTYEIDKSELNELPALLGRLIGHPSPLS